MSSYKGPRYWFRYLETLNFLKKYDLKGKKVLEIGAGTLHLSEYLASKGASVTALDMSEELKQSHKGLPVTLRDSITCIEADFLKHDFKSKNFDVIIAMEVLEHVEEEELFLEKVKKLLKDKGIIIISVPAHMSMWSKHDEAVGHLRRYEKDDFERVVGFLDIKDYELLAYGYPWINISRYLRMMTTPLVYKKVKDKSQVEKSVFSGKSIKKMNPLRFLSNKYVVYSFWLISRLFVKTDLSEGYVFFCKDVVNKF